MEEYGSITEWYEMITVSESDDDKSDGSVMVQEDERGGADVAGVLGGYPYSKSAWQFGLRFSRFPEESVLKGVSCYEEMRQY